jgi:hypothetical protein
MGSTERPPKALSERLISTRCALSTRELQIAVSAIGISVMSRPVNMSAKSATFRFDYDWHTSEETENEVYLDVRGPV